MPRPLVLHRLLRDTRAASAVEMALLAPVLFAMLFGVVSVGLYMQNMNAVRSLASDASRFAAVEYQKNNAMTPETLEASIQAMGTAQPYFLNRDRLQVDIQEVFPARVNGAREFDMDITYALPDIIGGTSIDNFNMSYSRPLFVLKTS